MLSNNAKSILEYLTHYIESNKVRAGKPESYLSYSQVHNDLNFEYIGATYGNSLDRNGMGELAAWLKLKSFPAITGLIISKTREGEEEIKGHSKRHSYMVPGRGYFEMYDRADLDFSWWKNEIEKSIVFNWAQCSTINLTNQLFPEIISGKYEEGASTTVKINRHERNAKARQACIDYWGAKCQVCAIVFSDVYGDDIGDSFIHVHHLTPISEIDDTYEVNPIEDLVPLCPNCHSMVHRTNPPMDPEILKERYMRLTGF